MSNVKSGEIDKVGARYLVLRRTCRTIAMVKLFTSSIVHGQENGSVYHGTRRSKKYQLENISIRVLGIGSCFGG